MDTAPVDKNLGLTSVPQKFKFLVLSYLARSTWFSARGSTGRVLTLHQTFLPARWAGRGAREITAMPTDEHLSTFLSTFLVETSLAALGTGSSRIKEMKQ